MNGFVRIGKEDAIAAAHIEKPFLDVVVEEFEVSGEEGSEGFAQRPAANHPLVVLPSTVEVRAVQAALRHGELEPVKDPQVASVHAERDVRLPSVSAEVPFAREDANEKALFERVQLHAASLNVLAFHRHDSRETFFRRG